MQLPSSFKQFLADIRLTSNMRQDVITGHKTLRGRLLSDEGVKNLIVSTFLQGSYRRATAVRPIRNTRADVDIVVVTRIKRSGYPDPERAMDLFIPFLEKQYKGKYKKQGRSFCIELSYVEMDLVITSAPSEEEESRYKSAAIMSEQTLEEAQDWRLLKSWLPASERSLAETKMFQEALQSEKEWQMQPLWIPDREAKQWRQTHPLEQMHWTIQKNASTNSHYVNVVKAIKWWELLNHEGLRPKGYPLEHLIGDCCPDNITTVAEGVVNVLEKIIAGYAAYALAKSKPFMADRGLPSNDVFGRITGEQFEEFWNKVNTAAKIAREAYDSQSAEQSSKKWRELFGDKFPLSEDDESKNSKEMREMGATVIVKSNPPQPWADTGYVVE